MKIEHRDGKLYLTAENAGDEHWLGHRADDYVRRVKIAMAEALKPEFERQERVDGGGEGAFAAYNLACSGGFMSVAP